MSWDAWAEEPQTEENPTWGDYGKAFGQGAAGMGSNLAAGGRYLAEGQNQNVADLFGAFQGALGKARDDITDSMTPEGRNRLSATLTSEQFWQHPASSMALKATGMLPMVAATVVPGALLADASLAVMAATATGGALSAGDVLDEVYKKTDATSDEDLKKASEFYAGLRGVFDEKESRRQYNEALLGMKPALNFVLGVATSAVGPAANIVRGMKGAATHGAARQAAEGAAGEMLQEGAANYSAQEALKEGGLQKDIDTGALVDAVLEGGVMGGAFGGAVGAVTGRGKAKANEIKAKRAVDEPADEPIVTPEVKAEDVNQQVKGQGTGNQVPPVETAPVGDKQNKPTRSETQYPKAEAAKNTKRKGEVNAPAAEVVQPGAPTTAEAAAVGDLQQKTRPEPGTPQIETRPTPDPELGVEAPAPVEVAPETAPMVSPDVAPIAPEAAPTVTPEVTAAPRVLENITPEARANVVDLNAVAAKNMARVEKVEQAQAAGKEVSKKTGEVLTGERKRGKAEVMHLEERAKHAKEVFDKHTKERPPEAPRSRAERDALAKEFGAVLEDAGARGLVLREDLPEALRQKVFPKKRKSGEPLVKREKATPEEFRQGHLSIPDKVAKTDKHVMYLREVAAVKRLLEKAAPLKKSDRERIERLFVAERDIAKGGNEILAQGRKEDGERASRQDQGEAEKVAADPGKVARAMEELGNQDHLSPEEKLIRQEEEELPDGVEITQGPSVKHIEVKPVERVKLNAAEKRAARKAAFAKPAPKAIEAPKAAESAPVKPKTIEATSDAAVTRAGKATNTNPSEAQKKAGNYAKGTVEWNGLMVALENPKGSVRRGKTGSGSNASEWSVQMQDHYGYVKRTEGADGDQVDVFMGPNPKSDQVWVIDQQDFNGKFDEHKVMLGYDSQAAAMEAYDRAFSDGRGFERVKDMQSMSVDEFKAWVKSDKPKKAKKSEPAIESALKTDIQSALNPSETIDSIKVIKAADALKSLNLQHLAGVPKAIADLMRNRLTALVGDVEVHIVSKSEMARAAGDLGVAFEPDGFGNLGLHRITINDGKSVVMLRADALTTPEQTAHVTLHEIAHAATVRAIVENPEAHATINQMMAETRAFLEFVPDIKKNLDYAFTDPKEFIAEAFSNPKVQEILAQVPMSRELSAKLQLNGKPTLWDAFVAFVRKTIEKTIGPIPEGHRMVEGILRLGNTFEKHQLDVLQRRARGEDISIKIQSGGEVTSKLVRELRDAVDTAVRRAQGKGMQEQVGKPWLLKLRTVDQLAQAAADYFVGNNPVRRVADVIEMTRVKATNLLRKSEPIIDELYTLEKKYKGKVWDDFTSLVHDETMAGVYADRDLAGNSHLGKDVLGNYWAKEQHAELAARYAALPEDLKAARAKAMKFFTDRQNAMSLGIIKNRVLKLMGIEDDALARRIHEGRTLDTDADLVGGARALELIKEAKELAKIEGPYFPLMRRGDHVVRAAFDVSAPKGATTATKVSDNEYEFTSRKEVIAYEKQLAKEGFARPSVRSRWVDKNTGKTTFPDGTKVTKQDTDAEQRFKVTVQNQHVEFFDSLAAAQEAAFKLAQDKSVHVKGVEERKFEWDRHADMLSHQIQSLVENLKRSERYKEMDPAQRQAVLSELHQASIRYLGSTRIQSRRLPRRYVEGASQDLTRNTLEYAQSSSGYLAKLEHQPHLEDAMKAVLAGVTNDQHKTKSAGRSAIANELQRRVAQQQDNVFDEGSVWNAATKRIMTVSFLDKLFGPSHNIINSLQPSMVTFPVLAARYGVGKSFDALSRAYRDVSGLSLIKTGLKDTVRKAKDGRAKTTDLLGDIKKNLNAKERAMLDYLAERGAIDIDAGFEIDRLIKSREGLGGSLDQGIGYLEGIARQMPQAIEMMNRSVSALATYRLEIGRGASHEAAMAKAQETVNNTQGNYSSSNAAPIFNHPLAKLALQFKKYGQMMYHLLGSNLGKAFKGETPEVRREAIKTLVGITATHVAMAGALGLPTEPFKYLLMGAKAAGLTDTGWNEVENAVREQTANWFGKTGGEIVAKGLPRAFGVDLSTRVGLDSVTSFGEPKSNKDTDVKSWLFDTLAGAPAALVSDWIKGANALTAGDFTTASEKLVPMKFAADLIKAYKLSTEGKKGSTGKETLAPYNAREAITRAMGFTPAREAEEGAKRSAYYSAQKRYTEERSGLITAWVSAKPQNKFDAWKRIQNYNRGRPANEQISMSDLTRAADRRRREGSAIKTTKRDEHLLRKAERTYNY